MFRWNNQKGAENVCKALGYNGGTYYKAPGGSGPILAGNRLCSGGEETVWNCPLQAGRSDMYRCSHKYDVGVICTGGINFPRQDFWLPCSPISPDLMSKVVGGGDGV